MKKVRKLVPLSFCDVLGLERWLEQQADAGLFPVYLNTWATFTPTGVPGTRFRLAAAGKTAQPSQEQLERYRGLGWEHVLTVGKLYHLFSAADPGAPDLFPDGRARAAGLEPLERQIRRGLRIQLAAFAALGALLVWALFLYRSEFDVQPDPFAKLPLVLLRLFHPAVLILCGAAVYAWRQEYREAGRLRRLCQALAEGRTPPSPAPSRRRLWEARAALVLIPVLLAVWLARAFGGGSLPLERFPQPYVPLQALEEQTLVSYEEALGPGSPRERENYAQRHLSLLSPVWYQVIQDGYVPAQGDYAGISPDPDGGNNLYHPSLETTCFRLLIPALARPAAEAQLDQYRLVNLYWRYEEVSYPGLDFVILAAAEPDGLWQMAALGRGGRAAVFRYAGVERLADHLDRLAALVL